jgi:cell division protein FtsB
MSIQSPTDKILAFRHSRPASSPSPESTKKANQPRQKLHPTVRRRRLIWLITMVTIICWASIQLVVQQFRIWNKEDELAAKSSQLTALEQRSKELEKEVHKLKYDEEYLNELAHKKGYSKPGEEVYSIKEKE